MDQFFHPVKFILLTILTVLSLSCSKPTTSIIITTSEGNIIVTLDLKNAPITASNFLKLCEKNVYSGASFYRTVNADNQAHNKIKIDVIQGGLFYDSIINRFTPILHETTNITGIKHKDGTISMARNEPGSASTEFFICIGDQPELDYGGARNPDNVGFSAFGVVSSGMEVVKKIHNTDNTDQYITKPVSIESIKILN